MKSEPKMLNGQNTNTEELNMKHLFSVFLAAAMLLSTVNIASAQGTVTPARLYDFYGNNMLFKQNETAVFSGTAPSGSVINCKIFDESNALYSDTSAAASDGVFTVEFAAPQGGYSEYSAVLACNGAVFAQLTGIVFGELWIANGQSNMMMPVSQTVGWDGIASTGVFGSEWIRVLQTPPEPTVNGKKAVPCEVQSNLEGSYWLKADSPEAGGISGVAYHFAHELENELHMPIGILSISLGGTPIHSWISREYIENSEEAMKSLKSSGRYISEDDWNPEKQSYYTDMSSNFNAKVYPLRNFGVSGMIWYQGETELLSNCPYGYYTHMMKLLQDSYSELFGCEADLPIVFTQLVSYNYRTDKRDMQTLNAEFAEICQSNADSMALISVSDIPLDFTPEVASIHPITKAPIGRRMAQSAAGLVYGREGVFSVSSLKSSKIENGCVYMTFDNVGDGLVADGAVLYDFAVCGSDGVYYKAEAQIVSNDTVKVRNEAITAPVSATYAFSQVNNRSNLWSTRNGERYLPVSPSVTNRGAATQYYNEFVWADCENEQFWRSASEDSLSGLKNIWQTEGCGYTVSENSAYSGTGGLGITAAAESFSISEPFVWLENGKKYNYNETTRKWSKYGAMTFYVRNTGENAVTLSSVNLEVMKGIWFSPELNGSNGASLVIPADGEWHAVEADLNELYIFGKSGTIGLPRAALDEVFSLSISFEGAVGDSLDLDALEFTPKKANDEGFSFDFVGKISKTAFYLVKALFMLAVNK